MASRPERYGRTGKVSRESNYSDPGTAVTRPGRRRAGRVLVGGARQVVIALGAPVRFVASRTLFRASARTRASGRDGRGDGGWGPPSAGDREPRRPKPGPPADAVARSEPRAQAAVPPA
jgi:hypothetical protein